jgi:Xaa-Pro aminopeptidase
MDQSVKHKEEMMKTEWARVPWDTESRRAWREIPFEISEYEARIHRLRELLDRFGLAGCVVHGYGNDTANIVYYTGWSNPYGGHVLMVVPADAQTPVLLTSAIVHGEPMHTEIYATWLDDVRCTPVRENARPYAGASSLEDLLIDALHEKTMHAGKLGFVGRFGASFQSLLSERGVPELVPLDNEVRALRSVKSAAEIVVMREAGRICARALEQGLLAAQPGQTEHDVAGAIAGKMLTEGADGPLYFIQAVSGPRSGFRNVRPSSRHLQNGDFLYLGMGLRYRGYCGRIGTGITIGVASPEQRAFLESNAEIVEQALAIARPGVRAAEMTRVATRLGDKLGVSRELWPGGHGLGIHTHELPFINPESEDTFEVGMTFVFEPMLLRTGFGTANVERVYVMTSSGPESLSDVPMKLWR